MNWLDILRRECAQAGSQRRVATALGMSVTAINQALNGSYAADTKAIEAKVLALYAEPAWLRALRAEVQRTSGTRAAMRLGISEATVSQVLSGKYAANPARIERRVRGELMAETCECPVLFELSTRVCQDVQERARGAIANPMYQQAWYACRGEGRFGDDGPCPHFNGGGNKPPATAVVAPPKPRPTPTRSSPATSPAPATQE